MTHWKLQKLLQEGTKIKCTLKIWSSVHALYFDHVRYLSTVIDF